MFPLVDKLLVAVFVPIWGLCFALSVQSAYEQRGSPTLTISTPPDASSYPVLEGFPSHAAATSSLQIGDRLLQLNRTDLRGIGPIGFATLAAQVRGPQRRASLTIERAGRQIETQVEAMRRARQQEAAAGASVSSQGTPALRHATCPACKAPIRDSGAAFCARCGTSLRAGCPACGVPVDAGDAFCSACGAQVGLGGKQAEVTPAGGSNA